MGFLHLICWTNDHFIKKHWNFDEIFDVRGCRFFEIFENLDFSTFDHCILYSFLRGLSLWQWGIDSTKQMMVYDQITFFSKKSNFWLVFVWLRNRFLDRTGPVFFLDRTGPNFSDRLDFWTGPARTGPVHSWQTRRVHDAHTWARRAVPISVLHRWGYETQKLVKQCGPQHKP